MVLKDATHFKCKQHAIHDRRGPEKYNSKHFTAAKQSLNTSFSKAPVTPNGDAT